MSDEKDNKQFDFETVAVIISALTESGVILGNKHYQRMAALDPQGRTASSFEHQFRKVKARAKQIQDQAKNGEIPAATPVKKPRTKGATPAKSSVKRGRKAASEMEDGGQDDDEESPTKKVKTEHSATGYEDDGDMV